MIAMDLERKKAAFSMAPVVMKPLAEGRRGVKDAYTRVEVEGRLIEPSKHEHTGDRKIHLKSSPEVEEHA